MTMAERMKIELQRRSGSARELAGRLGWTERQARSAIDTLRQQGGYTAVINLQGGYFALPSESNPRKAA